MIITNTKNPIQKLMPISIFYIINQIALAVKTNFKKDSTK